ncbi:MAG: alpha/beta fold hydrolase, partial [Gammaproteobacteria bacterium]|nr:alpha/beta fold hydrolase [Gammaproteobacteria bacterium]
AVLYRRDSGDFELLDTWAESLDFRSRYDLIEAAERQVSIVPANITFYPLRVRDNMLLKGAELLSKRDLSARAQEELIVEGNLLLRSTDMDIRLGDVLQPLITWKWWERRIVMRMARKLENFQQVFSAERPRPGLEARACAFGMRASIDKLRDTYMQDMYRSVTVNLSHLAAETILAFIDSGAQGIGRARLTNALYIATKLVQRQRHIHLHRSLSNPSVYGRVLHDESEELNQFLRSAARAELIETKPGQLRFREKILAEHAFDQIRLENPIEVYANEVGPLPIVASCVRDAMDKAITCSSSDMATFRFDDQIKQFEWDRYIYSDRKYDEINRVETATADPTPYLIEPDQARTTGVVLVHGFLASPAETRDFGNALAERGFAVLGARLAGHGTSPWDLRERRFEDWQDSVREALDIMRDRYERVLLIGFSTGGSLCAALAAEDQTGIAGLACICTPVLFRNRNMRFVPLVHGANNIVRWLTTFEGAITFRPNDSEHPHINYRHIPVRGLYELSRLTDLLKRSLSDITTPALLIQSTDDSVVNPESANILYDGLGSAFKRLHWIESTRHGILNEDVDRTHQLLLDFADQVDREVITPAGPRLEPQSPAVQPAPESTG